MDSSSGGGAMAPDDASSCEDAAPLLVLHSTTNPSSSPPRCIPKSEQVQVVWWEAWMPSSWTRPTRWWAIPSQSGGGGGGSGGCKQRWHKYSLPSLTSLVVLMLACSLLALHWTLARSSNAAAWWYRGDDPERAVAMATARQAAVSVTDAVLEELSRNGTSECHRHRTLGTRLYFQGREVVATTDEVLRLEADRAHEMRLVSVTEAGAARCAGGDFYEVDLVSRRWHSRPPTRDLGDGSYSITVEVSSRLAMAMEEEEPGPMEKQEQQPVEERTAVFNLTVVLLFDAFHGLDFECEPWEVRLQTVSMQLLLVAASSSSSSSAASARRRHGRVCGARDFAASSAPAGEWAGRWTRAWVNDSCTPDTSGRYRDYVPPAHDTCARGECRGRVSRLESGGWVYSRGDGGAPGHGGCGFRIYEAQEAWDCVAGKWLLFWGDSNFQDTIRNLLLFVLDLPVPPWSTLAAWQVSRLLDDAFVNPAAPHQLLHVTMLFNGHPEVSGNGVGLDSLLDARYAAAVAARFAGPRAPDAVVLNSGLHDGERFPTPAAFAAAAARAARFWSGVRDGVSRHRRPRMVYRTTVAPAGASRGMKSNPHKMAVFNAVMVDRMRAALPGLRLVDAFDLTFPWHYDNAYSDGGHYGRAPKVDKWPWFGQPHQYFVDVMLAHMLLNAICTND